jgi:hypothetical protein
MHCIPGICLIDDDALVVYHYQDEQDLVRYQKRNTRVVDNKSQGAESREIFARRCPSHSSSRQSRLPAIPSPEGGVGVVNRDVLTSRARLSHCVSYIVFCGTLRLSWKLHHRRRNVDLIAGNWFAIVFPKTVCLGCRLP